MQIKTYLSLQSGLWLLSIAILTFENKKETMLSNNDILKKLRVAHKLRNDDIVKILKLVDFEITESALGEMFRSEDHPKFQSAGDQILRKFLDGLIIHLRGPMPDKRK